MTKYAIKIKPFGEQALLIEWPNKVSESILFDILQFEKAIKTRIPKDWETVSAYNSLTIIANQPISDFKALIKETEQTYESADENLELNQQVWSIPVCYHEEFAIDMDEVTKTLKLSAEELIQKHTATEYLLFGIGFLPGFMYLGGLPKALEIPRRQTPRLKVAKGSVGLAAKQTGIYPQESPGGWNIIGRSPVNMFNPKSNPPCFIKVGDKVKFYEITRAEYDLKKIEAEVGIFKPEKLVANA